MTEWINPALAQAVTTYRAVVEASGHPRPPRSKWGRRPARRCSGGVVMVESSNGTTYTLPCPCTKPPN